MSTRKSSDALGRVLDVTNPSDRTPDNGRKTVARFSAVLSVPLSRPLREAGPATTINRLDPHKLGDQRQRDQAQSGACHQDRRSQSAVAVILLTEEYDGPAPLPAMTALCRELPVIQPR